MVWWAEGEFLDYREKVGWRGRKEMYRRVCTVIVKTGLKSRVETVKGEL